MRRSPLAAALLISSLAACQAEESSEPPAPDPTEAAIAAASTPTPAPSDMPQGQAPAASAAADSDCGADKVADRWLNALPTGDVMMEIAAAAGERTFRYYKQGNPITMDFSAARLNVEIGADGRIKRFWCG